MEGGESIVTTTEPSCEGAERREEERYAVSWDAEIFIPERTTMFRGQMVNISPSGCYVQTVAWVRVPPSTVVEVVFKLEGRLTRVQAEARYAQSRTGVGLRFLSLEKETRRRLGSALVDLATAAAAVPQTGEPGASADGEEEDEGAPGQGTV
jgi:PilZ domain